MNRLLIIFLLLCSSCFGAVTWDTQTSATGGGTGISFSHTVTASGSNRAVFLCIMNSDDSITFSSITAGGSAMTSHVRLTQTSGGIDALVQCYVKTNPTTGAITMAATASAAVDWNAVAFSGTGIHQTTPAGTAVTSTPALLNGGSSLNVSSVTGDIVVDCVTFTQDPGESGSGTIGASQTSIHDQGINDAFRMRCSREAGAGTVTMSWTHPWSNQVTAHVAFNIAAAAVSSAVPVLSTQWRQRRQ